MTLIPLEQGEQLKPLSLLELRQVDQQRRIHQQLTLDAQQQAAQYLVRNLAHEIKTAGWTARRGAALVPRA